MPGPKDIKRIRAAWLKDPLFKNEIGLKRPISYSRRRENESQP